MNKKETKELEVSRKKIEKTQGEPTREGISYVPDVDIIENDQAIVLRSDLPGVKKDDLKIDVHEGVLTLTGTVEAVPSHFNTIYQEYEIGGFSRRFTLGQHIDQQKIEAKLDNGVLTLTLPKAEAAKPRKIEIS
jgi:HSP20 family protein